MYIANISVTDIGVQVVVQIQQSDLLRNQYTPDHDFFPWLKEWAHRNLCNVREIVNLDLVCVDVGPVRQIQFSYKVKGT